jgi:hypothetical protein
MNELLALADNVVRHIRPTFGSSALGGGPRFDRSTNREIAEGPRKNNSGALRT